MSRIKAVIFDMDGVLIDAREWHYEALNRALGHFGFAISRYDHLVTYDGLPTRRKLELLSKEQSLPQGLHGFINDLKQSYTMEIVHAQCKPKFQTEYALSKLKSSGYRLAVASNSIRKTIEVMMEKSGLMRYLDVIVSNQDVRNPKPSPEIYAKACAELGSKPHEALVVEDNQHGIAAAKANGCHVMVVKDPTEVTIDRILESLNRIGK